MTAGDSVWTSLKIKTLGDPDKSHTVLWPLPQRPQPSTHNEY